jgi:uncharacterized protein DUF6348
MDNDDLQERLTLARKELARQLSSIYKTWTVDGDTVVGPGTLAVRVEDQHKASPKHLDIGFILNRNDADVPTLWDCAAGLGETSLEAVSRAVETWTRSTLPVMLELGSQDGTFADHFSFDDPQGCPGWHVIHGPLLAFGRGAAPDALQAWALSNPLLPVIGPLAASGFDRPLLNGVKLLFGFATEDIAEVRVNGVCNQPASDRLRSLGWPRAPEAAFARCYFLFVHEHRRS